LRSYVKELGELHSMPTIESNKWNYSKYRKLCIIISKNSGKEESTAFEKWRAAEQ
jgi:hypothetical protein